MLADLALAWLATLALSGVLVRTLPLSMGALLVVGAVYAAIAWGILRGLRTVHAATEGSLHWTGVGPANRVTLVRVVLSLPLAALAVWPGTVGVEARSWIIGLGSIALALDGLDGWLARRTGTHSPFGARFDMESDAALLMVLSLLAWRSGQVGPWVLGIGAMRYLFVAAGTAFPWLRGELEPSLRRKIWCVVQGIALLVALAPFTPAWIAQLACATALLGLAGSFGVDTLWLARQRR